MTLFLPTFYSMSIRSWSHKFEIDDVILASFYT
jgi:hypothetical protein